MELMIVLVIIGILGAAFVGYGGNLLGDSHTKSALAKLRALEAMVREYRSIEGEYPDDRLRGNTARNTKNANAEALFLALFDPDYSGSRPDQGWLVNTDGDESSRDVSSLGSRELFEIGDEWGNPIVYFESLHYADETACSVLNLDGEEFDVFAERNERTGSFYAPQDFQLVSAGEDGYFNTDDDLYSYSD
jgi:type II secretory pathway pseudopilin PulG